jgi:pimeloyl-ACP methyl ester carboxylesterase
VAASVVQALEVHFAACDLGGTPARCATVDVPENRGDPDGATVSLRVAVVDAVDTPAPFPMVLLSGGPGGSAIEDAPAFLDRFGLLRRDRDLVFVEQRGTGESNAVVCDPLPLGLRGTGVLFRAGAEWAERCLEEAGADVAFYGTAAFVDDLDDVLGRLGYDAVDVYGVSYGALAAQVLVERHPDRVRTMTLDGVSLLGVPVIAHMPRDSQRAFDLLVTRCAAVPECTAAFPDPAADLDTVLRRLATDPVALALDDPVTGEALVLDEILFAQVVHALLLSTDTAVMVPAVLGAAEAGAFGPTEQVVAGILAGTETTRLAMYATIRCNEAWAAPTADGTDARSYLAGAAQAQDEFYDGVCSVWTEVAIAAEESRPPVTDIPVLLLVGEADPQNPPSAVSGATTVMPSSVLAIARGFGHGIVQHACAIGLVRTLVDDGSIDDSALGCVDEMRPPPFVVPSG